MQTASKKRRTETKNWEIGPFSFTNKTPKKHVQFLRSFSREPLNISCPALRSMHSSLCFSVFCCSRYWVSSWACSSSSIPSIILIIFLYVLLYLRVYLCEASEDIEGVISVDFEFSVQYL